MPRKKFRLPMKYIIVIDPALFAMLFGGGVIYNLVAFNSTLRNPYWYPALIIAAFSFFLTWRFWIASINLTESDVRIIKLFRTKVIPIASVDNFKFVTGKFGIFVYVGIYSASELVARSSYGPIQNIIQVKKSKRMTRYIDDLNSSLLEFKKGNPSSTPSRNGEP